jgi:hypothetical protein
MSRSCETVALQPSRATDPDIALLKFADAVVVAS